MEKEMLVPTSPNYSYIFPFEASFDSQNAVDWMQNNWTIGFYYVTAYIVFVFGGQYLMKNRPRYVLKPLLATWNIFLGAFSIMGLIRALPEFVYVINHHGWYHSICSASNVEDPVSGFWTYMFVLSKLPELVDTIFIVLRKQNLLFLHWYHHVTTLLYSWYGFGRVTSFGRWLVVMNYFAHSLMYPYYALRTLGFKIPLRISMGITTVQLIQMAIGCVINISVFRILRNGEKCDIDYSNVYVSFFMYFTYMVLFADFFYRGYLLDDSKKKVSSETKSKLN